MRWELAVLLVICITLLFHLAVRPQVTRDRGGKMLAFAGIFLLPLAAAGVGINEYLEHSKERSFCLTCHVMGDHGKSLYIDDKEYLPAVHFQNNWVPQEKACYTCHTDYTVYGDAKTKFKALRHIYIQYLGHVPDTVKLYTPYNNRECLHCHGGSRRFEAQDAHRDTDTTLTAIMENRLSCMAAGCHDAVHDVKNLKGKEMWKGGRP